VVANIEAIIGQLYPATLRTVGGAPKTRHRSKIVHDRFGLKADID
jgi:hypothetical protein